MTPKTARFALWLALCAFAALSVAFYAGRRENDRLRSELFRVTLDRDEAARRLGSIERGVVIPAGTRRAIRQMQADGVALAP